MKKVPEFAACLQQAKEKISLNEPRKKKPTEQILEQLGARPFKDL